MSANNHTPAAFPFVEPEFGDDVRVDCYVRSAVPSAVTDQVDALVDRLRTLDERNAVDDVRVSRWPSQHAIADADRPTRDDLVETFERWAERRGYSLEPAFRRRTIPASPLGVEADAREQVRVPLVALAISETETAAETEAETDTAVGAKPLDAESLRGVVPCTERTDEERTHTVDRWLTAVETQSIGVSARNSLADQPMPLEGQR